MISLSLEDFNQSGPIVRTLRADLSVWKLQTSKPEDPIPNHIRMVGAPARSFEQILPLICASAMHESTLPAVGRVRGQPAVTVEDNAFKVWPSHLVTDYEISKAFSGSRKSQAQTGSKLNEAHAG